MSEGRWSEREITEDDHLEYDGWLDFRAWLAEQNDAVQGLRLRDQIDLYAKERP